MRRRPAGSDTLDVPFFAIFKDGEEAPTAAFASLEDAFDWACGRLDADSFSIKSFSVNSAGPRSRRSTLS